LGSFANMTIPIVHVPCLDEYANVRKKNWQ